MEEKRSEETVDKLNNERKKPGFLAGLCVGFGTGILILGVVLAVMTVKENNARIASEKTVLNPATEKKIELLEKAIDTYYYEYKDEEIGLEEKRNGLFYGMVDALNDQYSTYFTAEEFAEQLKDNQGIYYGIGAYISIADNGYPVIAGVIENTPAENIGLHEGDIIYKIEGKSTYGWELEEVVSHVKGEEGTKVHLTIYREGETDYLEMDVMRAKVESQTVDSEMLEDNIGYIQIEEFDDVTILQFANAYLELLDQDAAGLIIDLRSNPGGLFNAALEIARQLLPAGLVVYTEDKNGIRKDFSCDGSCEIQIPLVVLVNQYSASASEILAGAIKDREVGTIVGTKTFGKGIVQNMHTFSDGSAIKLTEKAYFTPNGNYIQGVGIEPDVEVEFDVAEYYEKGNDTQLNKAIEVIKEKMK